MADEERVAVPAAETDVGGPALGDRDLLDLSALGIEDRDALAGQVDVALGVEGHAVGAHRAEERLLGERRIGIDLVPVGLLVADVGDVEKLAVRRADDPVGLDEVRGHRRQRLAVGR